MTFLINFQNYEPIYCQSKYCHENCGTWELVWGGGAATELGLNVYTQYSPICELGPDVNTHFVAGLGPNVYTTSYMISQSYSYRLFPPWQSTWVTVNIRDNGIFSKKRRKMKVGVQGYFFFNFNPYVARAKDITHSISSSLSISAFYGLVHNKYYDDTNNISLKLI